MAYTRTMNGKVPQVLQELHFDEAPTPGSLNPVTSGGVAEAVVVAGDALQEQIDDIAEKAGSGYTPKGPASVATLNGLTEQENGWLYTMTDAGTLTDGSIAVVAGDSVAWDATNSVWYKAMNYAPAQYGTNEVHNLATSITAFRTGDVIPVDGPSGTAKMSKDDLLRVTAQNALAGNVAPAFDPTRDADHKYLVNEFVLYAGKLYRFDVSHYGAWNASHVHRVEVEEFLQCFRENSIAVQDFYQSATKAYYVKMDYNVGDSVPFTYVSFGGYACLVLPCKKGDVFKVDGTGGSASRLWGFVDSNDKLVAVADANKTETGVEHIAPCDGKFVFNTSTSGTTPYCKKVVSLQKIYSDYQDITYKKDLFADNAQVSKYITTNVGVGNAVNLTPSSNTSFSCIVLDCAEGDEFFIRGEGGSASRLWCFIDSSNKVVSVAGAGESTGSSGKKLVAPCAGKLIFNTLKSYSGGVPYCKVYSEIADYVDSNFDKIYKSLDDLDGTLIFKDVASSEVVNGYYIATNVGVGSVVDLTPVSESTFCYVVKNCSKGDLFEIRGSGGSVPRLWCFIDSSNKVVSVAGANTATGSTFLRLEAPVNGKIIFNASRNVLHNFRVLYKNQDYIDEQFANSNNRLDVLEKYDIPNDPTPFEQLGTLLADLDLSLNTRMEQIYDLFDDLVTDYPSLITKYDAAELVDLSYPRYANGVSAGDPDYIETPAYKTYIYKISDVNEAAGNLSAFPKKKLLIVGAVHGNEYYASVNCYSLAAHLLKNISSDLFSIFALFDVWIMPCSNGYGIIHSQRPNANNIDINRNFGTSKWTESGDIDLGTWSGDTANSEFEVQLIEGLKTYIVPDFYVDHHCSPAHSKAQFYSESPSKNVLARSYNSLVQISEFFIKNFPAYFGRSYHLFRDSVYAAALPYGTTQQQGHSDLWFYEQGIEAATVEVFGYINYTDGSYDESGHQGNDLWMVSEFTLRNQLAKYLPIVLT